MVDPSSGTRQWNNLAKWILILAAGFWVSFYYYGTLADYLPLLKTVAEICVPVYILTFAKLFLLHRGYENRAVTLFGHFVKFIIVISLILSADYIVSGRYMDGVDLIGGFMDMDFGWRIVILAAVVIALMLDQRKNSWSEPKKE